MNTCRVSILLVAVASVAACGGNSPTTPPPPQLSVGGGYTVAVALGDNSCGPVTVQTQPTTVTHAPGTNVFSLQHGGTTFRGVVALDGRFTADTLSVNDGASVLALDLFGRFTTTGLTATVTVQDNRPAPAPDCQYVVEWTGTKQGAPNVIP